MYETLLIRERAPGLFGHDELAGSDWDVIYQAGLPMTPENRLQIAILEDAVEVLQKAKKRNPTVRMSLYRETVWWVNHRGMEWPFSLDCVCDSLGLNSAAIRQGLQRIIDSPRAVDSQVETPL